MKRPVLDKERMGPFENVNKTHSFERQLYNIICRDD